MAPFLSHDGGGLAAAWLEEMKEKEKQPTPRNIFFTFFFFFFNHPLTVLVHGGHSLHRPFRVEPSLRSLARRGAHRRLRLRQLSDALMHVFSHVVLSHRGLVGKMTHVL